MAPLLHFAGSTTEVDPNNPVFTPLTDKEAPHIGNTSVADVGGQPLQKTVTVVFNEDLVNSNSANPQSLNNGDSLVANDFNFSLTGGTASLSNFSVIHDATAPAANQVTFNVTLNSIPSGQG